MLLAHILPCNIEAAILSGVAAVPVLVAWVMARVYAWRAR